MSNLRELPIGGFPQFSCDMERYLWLLRHEDDPLVEAWWIGFDFARKGRTFDRVIWRLENGI